MSELSNKNRPKKLEDLFREGMQEAEVAPSDLLWNRIERDLNIKETGYYKQRLAWYQRLAAACVLLVLFAGAYLFFDSRQHQQAPLANGAPAPAPVASGGPKPASRPNQSQAASQETAQTITRPQMPLADGLATSGLPPVNAAEDKNTRTRQIPAPAFTATAAKETANETAVANKVRTGFAGGPGGGKADLASAERTAPMPPGQTAGTALSATQAAVAAGPDSLAPSLNWPVLNTLAAVRDSVQPAAAMLAMAPVKEQPATTAQETGEKTASRWRFGGKYASQYFDQNIALTYKQAAPAYNSLLPNASVPFANAGAASYADALAEFDKETGSGFSFNTGLSAAYQLSKHIDLETGLGYTQNVATTSTSYIFNNAQLATRYSNDYARWHKESLSNLSPVATGIPSTAFLATLAGGATLNQTAVSKTQAFDTEYRYRMLGIPLKVNYQIKRRKSFYFASMGMLTNLLVQANILSESDRVPDLQYNPKAKDSPFRNWHFAALATAGKGFEISPGLQVKAGLEATQYLTHLTYHPDYLGGKQRKPYTIGLALSSSYTFGK